MHLLSGEGKSQTGIDKEFCLYRSILGPTHGQLFNFLKIGFNLVCLQLSGKTDRETSDN